MIDTQIIASSSDFISKSDTWGVRGLSVFFVLVMLCVFIFLIVYLVKNISKVVENNTDALNKNLDKTDREFDDVKNKFNEVKNKQHEIHADIKEILRKTDSVKKEKKWQEY